MIAGARVEVAPYKHDAMDFVLWKPSAPGEPAWTSPAGIGVPGRPGWHIECSAMSWQHLGEVFDIHGGGIDLVFPHHENEIAQTRSAFHSPAMANYWMHNGFLQVEGEKMSKSLGNFVTIRELLGTWAGDVLRLNMLRTHYRQPIDWRNEGLVSASKELLSWSELIGRHSDEVADISDPQATIDPGILEALADDLNTPLALSRLHQLFEAAQRDLSSLPQLARAASFFGFRHLPKPGYFHSQFAGPPLGLEERRQIHLYKMAVANGLPSAGSMQMKLEEAGYVPKINSAGELFIGSKDNQIGLNADPELALKDRVQALIRSRTAARKAKDFREADRIRDELAKMGVVLKDSKEGTTWEIAR